jgi:NAD(P)-dependent dehydrogenase (short-subunit alcohol dehydrogenase family)
VSSTRTRGLRRELLEHAALRDVGEPEPVHRREHHELPVVHQDAPVHGDLEILAGLREVPPVDRVRRSLPVVDAVVTLEIARMLRLLASRKVRRRTDDREALVVGHPNADHLATNRLAEMDAGVEAIRREVGEPGEGWEMQFATNHLGHFALSMGLYEALAAAGGARVVAVSSVGHVNGGVVLDDIHFERRPYEPWAAYSQSKTANVLFVVEAAKRWAADKIAVNALNPGRIVGTNLSRHMGPIQNAPATFEPNSKDVSWKTVPQGAATSVLLAGSPLVESVTGRHFEDCNEAEPHEPGVRRGVAAHALDRDNAKRLWQVSLDMLAAARSSVSTRQESQVVR